MKTVIDPEVITAKEADLPGTLQAFAEIPVTYVEVVHISPEEYSKMFLQCMLDFEAKLMKAQTDGSNYKELAIVFELVPKIKMYFR